MIPINQTIPALQSSNVPTEVKLLVGRGLDLEGEEHLVEPQELESDK